MRIWIAGSRGMVGAAIARAIVALPDDVVIDPPRAAVDLRDPTETTAWAVGAQPDALVLCAAVVGGIQDNLRRPAEYARDNLLIHVNAIHAAVMAGAGTVCVIGSSCMYPRACRQPMREVDLWTGHLEPTNVAYAAAKLAAIETALAYGRQHGVRVIVPVAPNLYGPGDRFDRARGHFLAGMVSAFCDANDGRGPRPILWGTGTPRREAMHVCDFSEAVVDLLCTTTYCGIVNCGVGRDRTISEWASLVAIASGWYDKGFDEAKIVVGDGTGFQDSVVAWNTSRPDGMPQKMMDSQVAEKILGRKLARTHDMDGLRDLCFEYRAQRDSEKETVGEEAGP